MDNKVSIFCVFVWVKLQWSPESHKALFEHGMGKHLSISRIEYPIPCIYPIKGEPTEECSWKSSLCLPNKGFPIQLVILERIVIKKRLN